MNGVASGSWLESGTWWPDVTMILIGGQRSRTNLARRSPSIVPGMSMSVKTARGQGNAGAV